MIVVAHAFGQRYELPIPLALFVAGGALVVLASFLLVYRSPVRSAGAVADDRTPVRPVARIRGPVGVVVLVLLILAGLLGAQDVPENIVPTAYWVVVLVGVPLSCGMVGDWTQPLNPFATLAKLADSARGRGAVLGDPAPVAWPRWLGWWPAAALVFLGGLGELVFNLTVTLPEMTAIALLVYAVYCLLGGLLFGRSFVEYGELFATMFGTWGRLGFYRFGAPGRRGFAGGLEVPFAPTISRIVFVLLLLVAVNFDGLLSTPRWASFERDTVGVATGQLELERTMTFGVLVILICLVFGGFAIAAARAGGRGSGLRPALAGLLPSVLPIAFGYLLAHYLQYLLVNGQLLLPLIGNPVGKDWWPIHLPFPFNDRYEVHPHFLPSALFWYVAVVVIVAVHVIAVVIAHRHLTRAASDVRSARRSEYPWLVAMVAYTMLSLWLLAQPLTTEKTAKPTSGAATAVAVSSRRSALEVGNSSAGQAAPWPR